MHDFPGLPDGMNDYQNQFDYSVWTPNTEVVCATVPWDSAYRDVVRFESEDAKKRYFEELRQYGYSFNINGMVYLRYGEPIRVNVPFSMINQCNYIIVRNPVQPVPQQQSGFGVPPRKPDVFYYFINDVKYIAPNTTQLEVQLDVWQTYCDRLQFGLCYVNKGHIGIANENCTLDNLADYLTDAEGLNIGDEYEVCAQWFHPFQREKDGMVALVMSSANLEGGLGSVESPVLTTATGTTSNGIAMGCNLYVCDALSNLMYQLADKPWVSQCINSITYFPSQLLDIDRTRPIEIGDGLTRAILYKVNGAPNTTRHLEVVNARSAFGIPDRYRNLKKFYTSPYTAYELTYQGGGEIVMKPECVHVDENDKIMLRMESVALPPSSRINIYPERYNAAADETGVEFEYWTPSGTTQPIVRKMPDGEGLDFCLSITNFPQVAIVNNMYLYYIASTQNARSYQFAAADWSQQKALTAASLSYDQASANMSNAWSNQMVANNANWALSDIAQEKNMWSGIQSGIHSVASGIGNVASGNIGGAVSDVVNVGLAAANTVANQDWINRTTATQVGAATQTTRNNIANQGFMRDTNYDYAQFAAKGDYETAIQGIQAKVQDAKLTQPTTAGQNGGDMFNISNGYFGVFVKWKRLKPNFMRQVGDFWLRYGYYVNRWIRPPRDLRCMERFTYWKMQYAQINAHMPEMFKQTFRGIFEKGVTVWSDPNDINNIDLADNEPMKGVWY